MENNKLNYTEEEKRKMFFVMNVFHYYNKENELEELLFSQEINKISHKLEYLKPLNKNDFKCLWEMLDTILTGNAEISQITTDKGYILNEIEYYPAEYMEKFKPYLKKWELQAQDKKDLKQKEEKNNVIRGIR